MRGEYDYTIYRAAQAGKKLLAIAVALFLIISFSGDAIAAEVKSETENAIRLTSGKGTITITDSRGKKTKATTKMRLDNGSMVTTSSKSFATVKIDSTKYIKLDSLSKAEVRKKEGKAEVLLDAGNLFFNVTSALSENEIFNIRTSNMVMSVRGTCAQVEILDSKHTRVSLLEGSLHCKITSLKSGESKTVILLAGQAADFYLSGKGEGDCKIVTEDVNPDAIRGFVLEELLNDKSLANKVFQQSGLDFRSLTSDVVESRIKKDQSTAVNTSAKAKVDSKKAIQMDFFREHEEGKILYTTEGDVVIIPEPVSEEQIAKEAPQADQASADNSSDNNSGRGRTVIREISAKSGPSGSESAHYRIIPSPTAVVLFHAYEGVGTSAKD
ncbi:FecR domain-containing protein [Butyrivibrio sp. WCD2001]|uniref:FecR domain-containing protein n=1 Tax=Butyrivibrio sp. WCD2001 TaxID=1280681 RepID=UPI00040667DD|nr:FecR domain-containing protein [Butyrivibrio sp. WCD2001]